MEWTRVMAGVLMLAALAATSQAQVVPKPRPKPARAESYAAAIPIPRPNPRRQSAVAKPPAAADWPAGKSGWTSAQIAAARSECRVLLQGLDLTYEALAPIGNDGGCGTAAPIALTRVAGVTLSPPATVNCDLAQNLHHWITATVQPAAQKHLKTQVTEVHVAASYVCRRRNNQSGGKLSEHAKANALDMSGFSFRKSDAVAIGAGWGGGILKSIGLSRNGSFLDDIRDDACKHFTTVLGPGSDAYHGDHFHVDVLRRRGDYRVCK